MTAVRKARASRPAINASTMRMYQAFLEHGVRNVTPDQVSDLLADIFDSGDAEANRNLRRQPPDQDWHVIHILDPESRLMRRHDTLSAARSRIEAVAALIHEIDISRELVSEVGIDGQSILFHGKNGPLAKIGPMEFSQVPASAVSRVERSLKGIRQYGDDERLESRLQDIPGLDALTLPRRQRSYNGQDKPSGPSFLKTPSSQVVVLREAIREKFGTDLNLSQCQELLATHWGARNWHEFASRAGDSIVDTRPVLIETIQGSKIYRRLSAAIWGFAEANRAWEGDQLEIQLNSILGVYITSTLRSDMQRQRDADLSSSHYVVLPQISLSYMEIPEPGQNYIQLAGKLLAAGPGAAAAILETTKEGYAAANARLATLDGGTVADHLKTRGTAQVGNWLLTRRHIDSYAEYFTIEVFGADGRVVRDWSAKRTDTLYGWTDDGVLRIFAQRAFDDFNELVRPDHLISNPDFTEAENRRVVEFLGLGSADSAIE